MQIEKSANAIRLTITAIVIAEYGLRKLVDDTKQDLKVRTKNAINSCLRVQEWFTTHYAAKPETRELFKQQFMGNEIVMLAELLETCFGINEDGLEEIINAVKTAIANETEA